MTTPFTPALEVLAGMAILIGPPLLMFLVLTYPTWPRMDAAWWKAAARNVGLAVVGLAVLLFLEYAMFFWAVPTLFFLAKHRVKIGLAILVGTILGIWGYCAYKNYKIEVALKRKHAGHADAWLLFHLICFALFITAFLYFHQQAMAHVALVWVFASVVGGVQYL